MLLRALAFVVVGVGILLAINDAAVGGTVLMFLLLVGLGGGIGAAIMIARGRREHQAPLSVPDAFARNQPEGILNVSRIRVAGIGGLGMVVVAAAMALTIPRIGVSLGLGLVGGFLIALALIPYRRAHAGRRT
jgi:hypothetical protein